MVVWAIDHFKYYLYGKKFNVIIDHQALFIALKPSDRSKTSQSRLIRWIDWLVAINFDIKHLAGNKMGLIDYMSRIPVGLGLAIPPSEYDEEFVVASINSFINNLEMIDNVILNQLAKKLASYRLIKNARKLKNATKANSLSSAFQTFHSLHKRSNHPRTRFQSFAHI